MSDNYYKSSVIRFKWENINFPYNPFVIRQIKVDAHTTLLTDFNISHTRFSGNR